MVAFLIKKRNPRVKVKVGFLIPWGEEFHWRIRPKCYEDLLNCWRDSWNLFHEDSEVAVQSAADHLDLFVDILVRALFDVSSFSVSPCFPHDLVSD